MKIILPIIILISLSSHAFAFDLFGFNPQFKAIKDSIEKTASDNKVGLNDNTTKIASLENSILSMNTNINTKLDSIINAKVTANVGYTQGNTETSAGRDLTQANQTTSTNDASLMNSIFKGLTGALITIVMALIGYIKIQGNQLKEAREQLGKMLADKDDDYDRLVKWQLNYFDEALKAKEEYKSKYMNLLEGNK